MTQNERQQQIEIYGQAVAVLEVTLEGIPRSAWKFKPQPSERRQCTAPCAGAT